MKDYRLQIQCENFCHKGKEFLIVLHSPFTQRLFIEPCNDIARANNKLVFVFPIETTDEMNFFVTMEGDWDYNHSYPLNTWEKSKSIGFDRFNYIMSDHKNVLVETRIDNRFQTHYLVDREHNDISEPKVKFGCLLYEGKELQFVRDREKDYPRNDHYLKIPVLYQGNINNQRRTTNAVNTAYNNDKTYKSYNSELK